MIKTTARLRGNLAKNLKSFEDDVKNKVLLSGVAAAARVVYEEVKLNASGYRATGQPGSPPGRVTGALSSAIYRAYSPESSTDERKVYKVSVNKTKARHWWLVEYGTSRAPAHPYLRPATARLPDAIAAGKDAMRKRMRGA